MSALALHRAAIVAALSTVPGIGVVHDRERYSKDASKFAAQYVYTPADGRQQIRGWWVRRVKTAETMRNVSRTLCVHTWQIRGFMAFSDADQSELTFDELIEAFRTVVRADQSLGGALQPGPLDDDEAGVQVLDSGSVMFAGSLCHSATLQLKTWSYS